jgi:hypothetical protein
MTRVANTHALYPDLDAAAVATAAGVAHLLVMRVACIVLTAAACAATRPAAAPQANGVPLANAPPPTPAPPPSSRLLAELSRGGCYGTCPIYTVTVYDDGRVEYKGERDVEVIGARADRLDDATLAALRGAFDGADFEKLSDFVRNDCTDLPTVEIRYGDKTVHHYHGDRSAPEALWKLEQKLDELVKSARWVGEHPGGAYGTTCFR